LIIFVFFVGLRPLVFGSLLRRFGLWDASLWCYRSDLRLVFGTLLPISIGMGLPQRLTPTTYTPTNVKNKTTKRIAKPGIMLTNSFGKTKLGIGEPRNALLVFGTLLRHFGLWDAPLWCCRSDLRLVFGLLLRSLLVFGTLRFGAAAATYSYGLQLLVRSAFRSVHYTIAMSRAVALN